MRALVRLFKLLLVLAVITAAWAWFDAQKMLDARLPIIRPTPVEIDSGSTLATVLDRLAARGLLGSVRTPLYLRAYARFTGDEGRIKAGEYELQPGLTPRGLLDLFVSGKVKLHELVIVEGWSFAQALQAVHDAPALKHTLARASPAAVMEAIGQPGVHPEGRFLPETYRFPRGTTDVSFLRRAFDAMEKALTEEWARRGPSTTLATPLDALILASIVEKETAVPDERTQIAGVFLRRLQRNMRLQTDPTVIYGMGAGFDGNLRRTDLETDTPYNSYLREGLPPTPICLPGRASIHAALHPAAGTSLYFVARGDGSHQFSDTLEQHTAAVRRYQLKQAPRAGPNPDPTVRP